MLNFLHTYLPDPTLLTIGRISIHWYGLLIAMAVLAGYGLVKKLARRRALDLDLVSGLYLNLLIWGFIGARFYHVLNEWGFYWQNPAQIMAVWQGGLAIHGAIIAGLLVILYYWRVHRIDFWALADLYCLPLILGQAIGRWGNYFNQELFGRPTNLPWGIPITVSNRPAGFEANTFFHPVFLYESLWNLLALGALYWLWRKNKNQPGLIFWVYISLYSLGRAAMELLRIDRTPAIFGLRLPLVVSAALVVIASVALVVLFFKNKQTVNSRF